MVTLFLITFAAICNSIMDVIDHKFMMSIFKKFNHNFWNPLFSWKNKWKDGDYTKGEKFWGSSTIFVWTTDAWHLFKSLMLASLILSVVLYSPMFKWWIDVIIYRAVYGLTFELFYSKIWRD